MTAPGEQPLFFGPSDARRFGVLHSPAPGAFGGTPWSVLVCAPIAHEHGFSHRMLVELARALARAGAHVLRFDYRGHGDSAGRFEDFAFDDLRADAELALEELEARTGATCRVIFGLRMGAPLAIELAAKRGASAPILVLWEPVAQGDKHLDEVLRVVMSKDVAHAPGGKPRTRVELRQAIVDGGEVLLEGHPITKRWYESLMALDLYKANVVPASRTLILQLPTGKSGNVRKELEQLKAHLASQGAHVDLEVVSTPCLWWGPLTREFDARNRPLPVFEKTVSWLKQALAETPAPAPMGAPAPEPAAGEPRLAERLVGVRVDDMTIPAVLHEARRDGPRRAVAVMLPQGMNRRTGWNRLYVKIARSLAERGIPTVRFDARGFGDAPGVQELATGEDVFVAVQKGLHLADSRAVIDEVSRLLGPRPIVLIGICGGAVTAGLLVPEDERVVGAAYVETELTYTTMVYEEEAEYRVLEKLRDPEKWKRLLSMNADYKKHARSAVRIVKKRVVAKVVEKLRARGLPIPAPEDGKWLGEILGETVNMPLFEGFMATFRRKIPMLFTFGDTENQTAFDQIKGRFLGAFPETRRWVREVPVRGADHDFLAPKYADELVTLLGDWITDPTQPWADPSQPKGA
ncbi:alpha/beta fold hydrolase [Myxococcota bacterium]|nr:alpha/beta fold hydrolase [Myxococcota bacterium]